MLCGTGAWICEVAQRLDAMVALYFGYVHAADLESIVIHNPLLYLCERWFDRLVPQVIRIFRHIADIEIFCRVLVVHVHSR